MKMAAAVSNAGGTTLPRAGFFFGVHPPQYQAVVVAAELASAQPGGENRSYIPASGDEVQQTTALSQPRCRLLLESLLQTGPAVVRADDLAHAVLPGWSSTDSPWQSFRRALMPLRLASEALDEDVRDTLKSERLPDARATHAGLTAVSRLVDILGLTRPTILRMGGVPSSTFYAWQNSPNAVIRTPTISRLLRLQAQIAILDEALGRDRMRAWVLSCGAFREVARKRDGIRAGAGRSSRGPSRGNPHQATASPTPHRLHGEPRQGRFSRTVGGLASPILSVHQLSV